MRGWPAGKISRPHDAQQQQRQGHDGGCQQQPRANQPNRQTQFRTHKQQ